MFRWMMRGSGFTKILEDEFGLTFDELMDLFPG